jgi:hypothetical protein
MGVFRGAVVVMMALGVVLLCTATPSAAAAQDDTAVVTAIEIDGNPSDWVDRPLAGRDSTMDAEAGCVELGTGYAFVNRNALYLLIETHGEDRSCVQFDIEILADRRMILLSWSPGNDAAFAGDVTHDYVAIGETQFSQIALGTHLEARIDRRDLGSPQQADVRIVCAMVGTCCRYPGWRAGDEWQGRTTTPVVDEVDPTRLTSGNLSTAENPFGLPDGWSWDRLMVPPAADITGIACSEDGTVFVQHSGLAGGLSILDPQTGQMTRIIELAGEDSLYGTLVGGPEDTLFLPLATKNVIWQIASDGTHTVWGSAADGWPVAYTEDGRLLGRGHNGALLHLQPNGTATILSERFEDLDSVVPIGDRLFVSDTERGAIVRIDPDGSHHTLCEGLLYRDPMDMAASPAGDLYLNCVTTGLVRVDPEHGSLTPVPIDSEVLCTVHPADFDFASSTTVVFADPTESQVAWLDITTGKHGLLVSGHGANSWALAVGPDDAVYVGVSGCGEQAARIDRYAPDGTRTPYVDGLRGEIKDIAFDTAGGLYIATHDPRGGTALTYYVSVGSQALERIWGVEGIYTLTVDPTTNRAFGGDWSGERILEFDRWILWREHRVRFPEPIEDLHLSFAPNGALYASCSAAENADTGPVVKLWLLEIDTADDGASIFVQHDWQGCCTMLNCHAAPDGSLWWLINPAFELHRVNPTDGQMERFAHHLPIDPAAVAVDSQGTIYLTSPSGILRFAPPNER